MSPACFPVAPTLHASHIYIRFLFSAARLSYTEGICAAGRAAAGTTSLLLPRTCRNELAHNTTGAVAADAAVAGAAVPVPGRIDWDAMPASLDPARGEEGLGGIVAGGGVLGCWPRATLTRLSTAFEEELCLRRALRAPSSSGLHIGLVA